MAEWVLATSFTELNDYVKEILCQNRKKADIIEVKNMEQLLRIITHHQPDLLLLTESFFSNVNKNFSDEAENVTDEDIIRYLSRIRFLSNVRVIYFAPGREGGDYVLDHIIRECGVYDLFLEAEIDGKRLQSVLFSPSEKCSVAHLLLPSVKDEVSGKKEELIELGNERQKKILQNILSGISEKDLNSILKEMPSEIKNRLIKQEVVEKVIIREVPKVIIKNNIKVIEKLNIQKQQTIAFWSPKSHQGSSHILTQLSLLLSRQSGARILVMDLNVDDPSLDMYYGFKRNYSKLDLPDDSSALQDLVEALEQNKLDINVLKEKTREARQGLDIIFNNPYVRQRKELKGSHIKNLIDTASELYDYILLDLPGSLENEATAAALKKSGSIIIISEGELTAIRSLHTRLLSNGALFHKDKCKIIINKAIPGVLGESEIKDFLGQEFDISFIPYNERCIASILQQKPFIYSCTRKEQLPYKNILEKIISNRKGVTL